MDNIKISLSEVSELAAQMRSLNIRMKDTLDRVKGQMNDLRAVWESESSDTLRERFNFFSVKFEQCYEVIDNYARFLDLTVASYDATETTINTNASSFK
ncbi:MAG: pore-forming ESAT-6 family protein [Erysipelotrichaceae bacterium]|jgi:WXG100 family type VII secretion target|nr:pore-forming ESAT-6 family protein [Erysipelotrichaceae bacterium]